LQQKFAPKIDLGDSGFFLRVIKFYICRVYVSKRQRYTVSHVVLSKNKKLSMNFKQTMQQKQHHYILRKLLKEKNWLMTTDFVDFSFTI